PPDSLPRNNWLLNYSLDFILALFVFVLTLFIRAQATNNWGWYPKDGGKGMFSILKFFGFSDLTARSFYPNALLLGVYGPGMICCILFGFGRAFRFGLAMSALMIVALLMKEQADNVVYAGRSYFGVLRVLEDTDRLVYRDEDGQVKFIDPDIRLKD